MNNEYTTIDVFRVYAARDAYRELIEEGVTYNEAREIVALVDRLIAENERLSEQVKALQALKASDLATANDLHAENEALKDKLFALGAMKDAPCFACGYNGPGYYQSDQHPCAARHHAALSAKGKEA